MQEYHKPIYLISVVSDMLDIHPQTLRQYEREGLINPFRNKGSIRLYSQYDIDRMKMILRLTRDMGINLAGVDVILRLKEQMDQMEQEIFHLKKELHCSNLHKTTTARRQIVKKSHYDIIIFED